MEKCLIDTQEYVTQHLQIKKRKKNTLGIIKFITCQEEINEINLFVHGIFRIKSNLYIIIDKKKYKSSRIKKL